jgi:hypothetical protein
MPAEIPPGNSNLGKIVLAKYLTAHKDRTPDTKKITQDKLAAFSLTYGQLSESSRCEVQNDEEWVENYNERNLLYLIQRIRGTHIARQTGNPGQDRERVQMAWANIRMQPHETSFAFRKRVDDHQLGRTSVGLPVIPEDELVVGILIRLDMSRYSTLARDYFDNERRGITARPEASSTLWKEVKDAQESTISRAFTSPEWTRLKLTEEGAEVEGSAQPAVAEGAEDEAVFRMKKRATLKILKPPQQPVQSLLITLSAGHAVKRATAPTFAQLSGSSSPQLKTTRPSKDRPRQLYPSPQEQLP